MYLYMYIFRVLIHNMSVLNTALQETANIAISVQIDWYYSRAKFHKRRQACT
jgi:hypothetical protein